VLSGRGLCDELITHPEESYRLCCVAVCDLETPRMRRPWPTLGRSATKKIDKLIDVKWTVHVASINKMRKSYKILLDKCKEESHLGDVGIDGRIM